MKKILALSLIAIFAVAFTSCRTMSRDPLEGKSYDFEGWLNDDTIVVRAMCVPKRTLTNKVQRMESSRSCALTRAQGRVIEILKGAAIEGATGAVDAESTGEAIAKEFSGEIKGGMIREGSVKFDEEQNCSLQFVFEKSGLKKHVKSMAVVK